jgi:hypothetical protein
MHGRDCVTQFDRTFSLIVRGACHCGQLRAGLCVRGPPSTGLSSAIEEHSLLVCPGSMGPKHCLRLTFRFEEGARRAPAAPSGAVSESCPERRAAISNRSLASSESRSTSCAESSEFFARSAPHGSGASPASAIVANASIPSAAMVWFRACLFELRIWRRSHREIVPMPGYFTRRVDAAHHNARRAAPPGFGVGGLPC